MTSYELFNPDSIEFKKRHLTDLTFWKHYAEEKASYHDLLSKKMLKTVNEYRKKLVKIDGFKDFPLLKSFEAAMTRDEMQAEELRSVASSFSCLTRDLQSELDSISTSEYEKEAVAFRKLVKIHSKVLRETESDRDKISHVAFKLERIYTNACKNEKYNSTKQLLDNTIASYDINKESELLLRAKIISKSVELKKLWMEEEKERLDVLLRGWKDCLTVENQLIKHTHQSHGDRALKIADNIYNEDVISELAIMRMSPHKYRDFEDSCILVGKAAKHLDTGDMLNTTDEEITKLHGKSRCKTAVGAVGKNNNTEEKHCKSLTILQTPSANIPHEKNRSATLPASERRKTNRRKDRQLAHSIDKDDNRYEISRRRKTKKSNARATLPYHPENLQYTEIQDLSKVDDNTSDDENLSVFGDKRLKHGKTKTKIESGDGIKPLKCSNKKVYARVIPQRRQTEDTRRTVTHHDHSNEGSLDSSDDDSSVTDSGGVASTDHYSSVEREGFTGEATTANKKGKTIPVSDSATFSYLSASEILNLREDATRRLNVYLHLVATEMYKSNDYSTMSLKKGESIVMMQTPTTDGLAFGYKKIRLNTKKKYGLFHVNLTKIDYSVNQNLENVLRIKQ
ncbi:Hypothetical predicted protein [Mytilus galloprovincialis]|uniref:SH3 domain-containing protein n=1 Tax=Mytilus galloprovincialis TaxID=29158 RepID=A0A8B6H3X1_MYTGA|nr:Hypothetical predicted protein [Mytilus galloprovincialis]